MNQSDEEEYFKSKSQLKREMHDLQNLGQALCEAPLSLRQRCELPELLETAVEDYNRMKSNGARKRQLQFIGRVMRDVEEQVIEQISKVLDSSDQHAEAQRRRFHRLEVLRDSLLAEEPGALEELIKTSWQLDLQHVRQLIRQARKESEQNKPPAASRKLFRHLKELSELSELSEAKDQD